MTQALKATVTIQVPEDKVLVDKVQYLEMKREKEVGKIWNLVEFKKELQIPKSLNWLREVLLKPRRDEISDWCKIRDGQSGRGGYIIHASKAREWIEENFDKIDWDEKI